MAEPMTVLSEELFQSLQQQHLVLLSTIDGESGAPTQNAISWIYAVSHQQLRFSVDARSKIVLNLKKNPNCVVSLFANESIFAISGNAFVREDLLQDVPLKLICIDVNVTAVRDIMYYGSKIAVQPVCEKTYDQRAADKLDTQVFDAMKKA